jgi:phospholipid-binding lipoprotein MlaA
MTPHRFRTISSAITLLCAAALSACAGAPAPATDAGAQTADPGNNDPYESVNRTMWDVDLALKDYLLSPIALGYRTVTPDFFQSAVNHALRNLDGPRIFVNDLFQGNMERAGQTLTRLTLNTVVGLGGLIDVAADQGIPYHDADFGATLGAWGVAPGPYLVLPLLGPSDPRDGIGRGVDAYTDPFNVEMHAHQMDLAGYARFGADVVNSEVQIHDLFEEQRKSSLDFYAAVRSLYQQKRAADVATAKNPDAPSLPNVPYDEVEPSSPAPSNPPAAAAGPAKAK